MFEFLKEIDFKLFLFFNGHHNTFFDAIMYAISGKAIWLPLYIGILAGIIYRFKKQSWIILLSVVLLIVLSDQLSVQLFKNVFQRLRPCHNPILANLVHLVNGECGGKYGFVSSHAANTFALAIFTLMLFRNRAYTISILFWAAVVSFSRIYLGVHFPADVTVGALLGIAIGFGVYYLQGAIRKGVYSKEEFGR